MNYLLPPWAHQLAAIEKAKLLPHYGLFFEMGAGKTMTAINILRHKMTEKKQLLRTIIFCPPIVCTNWKAEFLKNSKIPAELITVLDGSGVTRVDDFTKKAFEPQGTKRRSHFFITNYESLLLGGKRVGEGTRQKYEPGPLFRALALWGPEAIIFDESHRLKNQKAERSKLAQKLANPRGKPKPLTYILSGSPILNSPMDLFQQFLILDGGATFGLNFFIFRAKYFEDKNAGMLKSKESAARYFPKWEIKVGALELMSELIFKSAMRVTKLECMDLPEEISVTIPCGMTPLQTRNYKELKREYITYIEDKNCQANLAIVKALRLMQVTSGFLPLAREGEQVDEMFASPAIHRYEKCPKDEALSELLEDLTPHHKVIVWAVWKENYASVRRICDELKIGYVEVHGGISRKSQDEAVERFKSDPQTRVFIGHPGSGGIGINLTCAPYSIFYSRTFSLEHFLQARARNHRGGQAEKVTHYDLVCEGTIDVLVQNRLAQKLEMSKSLLTQINTDLRGQG